ncbi:MAG: flavin reductase [Bacteroidaceae bacterium]
MRQIDIKDLTDNVIELIGKEWMLVTAGTLDHFNTMTASWGGIGFLWNKPVAFVFVRPERYTYDFLEAEDGLTLSFLGEAGKVIHKICGSTSGRTTDKVKETGLQPFAASNGSVAFKQARLTLECKKLYAEELRADKFLSASDLEQWYNARPGGSMHKMYIVEIEKVFVQD